ncbi:MAG: polysaccharide deacetylase family protein [Gemmobacter sp.]
MRLDGLRRVLDAREEPVAFWLRDDDAVAPSAALDLLLGLGVPVTVAVIPAPSGAALAARLAEAAGVSVAVHGWTHANHAGPGEKAQELGAHRPVEEVAGELARGFAHLAALHGERFVPLLVPPWNRIAPGVEAVLPGLGFRALSVFGPSRPFSAWPGLLPRVNAHVDLIDWRGTRGGRSAEDLEAGVITAMAAGGPVGILAHHLVHDGAAWGFLAALGEVVTAHPMARWAGVGALVPGLGAGG